MTSGNISDEPIVTSNEAARQQLSEVADWFLFHNRGYIHARRRFGCGTFEERSSVLRRSRGYAPRPIDLDSGVTELLRLRRATEEHFLRHQRPLRNLEPAHWRRGQLRDTGVLSTRLGQADKKLFRVEPRAVATIFIRLPDFALSRWNCSLRKIGVQHHHAHIAQLHGGKPSAREGDRRRFRWYWLRHGWPDLGRRISCRGLRAFERRAHFRYVPLAGGDAAVRQAVASGIELVAGILWKSVAV